MMVPDEIILKAILREMPDLHPWCEDEWGDNEIEWVIREVDRMYFDPNAMRGSLIEFARIMYPADSGGIYAMKLQTANDIANFADTVMRRIKSYSMVDNDLHGVLDV